MTIANNWRITFLPHSSYTTVRMSDVHMLDATGAVITATHTVVLAGKNGVWADAEIEDGNTNQSLEFLMSTMPLPNVIFNFASPQEVVGVQIYSSNDTDGSAVTLAPVNFELDWYNDVPSHPTSSGWAKEFSVGGGTWTADQQPKTFYKPVPGGGGGTGGPSGDGGTGGGVVGPPTLGPALVPCNDDFFAEAQTGAWGLRRLVNAWAGPLIRIRNPDNDVEFDVQQTIDGKLDLTLIYDDNYLVVAVYDQTGNGSHMGQSSHSKQPKLFRAKTPVSGPAIFFDGVDDGFVDVNGYRNNAHYMTPNPNMFWMGGAGLDGVLNGQFIPLMYIDEVSPATANPYNHPISIQWNSIRDDLTNISAWNTYNSTIFTNTQMGQSKGWGGFALVPSNGAFFTANTLHGGESPVTVSAAATYNSNSTLSLGNDTSFALGYRHYFVEAYMLDGPLVETTNNINDWFTARYQDIIQPKTIWRITVHNTFANAAPAGASYVTSAAEIQLANAPGGANLALNSILVPDVNTIDNGASSAMFDGFLDAVNLSLTANAGFEAIFTFQPVFFETNSAEELRITTLRTNIINSANMYKTFKLERSNDRGSTYVDLGQYDASLELDPTIDSYTYTFTIGNVASDFAFTYQIGHPDITIDFDFDYEVHGIPFTRSSDWRLYIITNGGAANCGFGEIEMRSSYGGAQACVGGTPTASGSDYGPAANALDGDASTYWATGGYIGRWWRYHFPAPIGMKEISLTSFILGGNGPAHYPKDFDMQYLDTDGVTWITKWGIRGATALTDNQTNIYNDIFIADFTSDYKIGTYISAGWRLLIHTNNGGTNSGFADLLFRAIPGGAVSSVGGTGSASNTGGGSVAGGLDGDPSTYWVVVGIDGQWLQYHFPAPVYINEISLTAFTVSGLGTSYYPQNFDIQYLGSDGVTWFTKWSVTGASVAAEGDSHDYIDPSYVAPAVDEDFIFDYGIEGSGGVIPVTQNFIFDYGFNPPLIADFTCTYALSVIVGIRHDFAFDYQLLPTFSVVGLPSLRMPPEAPITETLAYVSNVIQAYDSTEQRASLAQFAYSDVALTFVILNDDDRRQFMRDFMAISRGVCLVPQWQYGANMKAAALGAEIVEYDPTTTDIRSGDYIYYLTPQALTGYVGQVANINPTGAALMAPLLAAMPAGSWIMPARKMHWSDGSGVVMQSIAGSASVSMNGLGLRSPMREGQATGLVSSFDGLPLLDVRPLVPANDLFTGGDLVLALSADQPTEIFSPFKLPVVAGTRSFLASRGQGLDFWREFMDAASGQRKPFLMPSFRADLLPVSISGDLLRVAGQDYLPLAGFPAYSRLAVQTETGVTNYKIIGAEALDSDTIIQTSVAITGTIRKISYLNQFRLGSDSIKLTHDVTNVQVDISVRTANE